MRTVALIGDPVAQSPSPAMHRAAFVAAGLDLDYVAERVTRDDLRGEFGRLREQHLGLNVTRPLKEAIVPLLDDVRGDAAATGSVNTVTFLEGRAVGDSTDGSGFMAALTRAGTPSPTRAVILGAGGSARAVGAALVSSGAEVTIAARDPARGLATARALGATLISMDSYDISEAIEPADLLVNATPLGRETPLPGGVELHPELTVFDLVYTPRVTRLLMAARVMGCRTVEGVDMLVEQGALSFEIWTGLRPPTEAMRDAALAALERRAGV
jgi:shikimate dehydrogenase